MSEASNSMRLRCTLQSLQSICCPLFIVFEPGSSQNVNELIAVIAVCCPWNPRRLMFARYLRGCTRFDRKGYASYIFWLARAILAVLLLCILRCPRAALAGPPILVSCILCLCLPLASVLLRCRVCLCLACILSLCLCLAPVLGPTTARMSVLCLASLSWAMSLVYMREGMRNDTFLAQSRPCFMRSDTPSDPN